MKLAYVTTFNSQILTGFNEWAGTGYYIAQSLQRQSIPMHYIGSLQERIALQIMGKFKNHYYKIGQNKDYLKSVDPIFLKNYASQVSQELSKTKNDIVFSATVTPTAYLECNQPIVFWADATFENLLNYYPLYKNLCEETIEHGHLMEKRALQKCKLAIYSSEWAAKTAIEYYKTPPSKVKVVPFGANIENERTIDEIKELIKLRPSNKCKLLFIGTDWLRKGGDIALKIAEELNKSGLDTELTIIGCQPNLDKPMPSFVKVLGFISKASKEGSQIMNKFISESHLLILPSISECYGIVFCEANSFGVPCISTQVGGIPSIIRNNINGMLFDRNVSIDAYCQYISSLFIKYAEYEKLAFSSFHEYKSRLNWSVAGKIVKNLLNDL